MKFLFDLFPVILFFAAYKLLGIYAAIRVLFPHSEESRNQWVSRANTAHLFCGRSPIEIMRSGMIGLYQTFAHLSAARAW